MVDSPSFASRGEALQYAVCFATLKQIILYIRDRRFTSRTKLRFLPHIMLLLYLESFLSRSTQESGLSPRKQKRRKRARKEKNNMPASKSF